LAPTVAKTVGDIGSALATKAYHDELQYQALAVQASRNNDPVAAADYAAKAKAAATTAANWGDNGIYRVGLHAATQGLLGDLADGRSGALQSAAGVVGGNLGQQLGEQLGNAQADKLGLPPGAARDALVNAYQQTGAVVGGLVAGATAAGATGNAANGGALLAAAQGGSTAATVDANNRQLHPDEKARIKQLAGGDPTKEARLTVAACALVKCYAEYPEDSAAYQQLKLLADLGASAALAGERQQLSKQPDMFGYSTTRSFSDPIFSDEKVDAAKRLNNTYQLGIRAIGAGQTVLGGLGLAGALVTAPASCATGIGCVANAAVGTISLDVMYAGAKQTGSGKPESTFLNQGLQSLGMSPQAAALTEAALGIGSAATAASAANKAINQSIALNKLAAGSYQNEIAPSGAGNSGYTPLLPGNVAPGMISDLRTISAAEANAPFLAKGWSAPYDAASQVRTFTTNQEIMFVRVSTVENPQGAFLVRASEVDGMTPVQIQQHLALPKVPTQIANVAVPAGTRMQVGRVAAQPLFGASSKGGVQYQLLDQIPAAKFGTPKPISGGH
jgi:filamentous hemagglutinin